MEFINGVGKETGFSLGQFEGCEEEFHTLLLRFSTRLLCHDHISCECVKNVLHKHLKVIIYTKYQVLSSYFKRFLKSSFSSVRLIGYSLVSINNNCTFKRISVVNNCYGFFQSVTIS